MATWINSRSLSVACISSPSVKIKYRPIESIFSRASEKILYLERRAIYTIGVFSVSHCKIKRILMERSLHSQLKPGGLGHSRRLPRGVPYHFNLGIGNAGNLLDLSLHFRRQR